DDGWHFCLHPVASHGERLRRADRRARGPRAAPAVRRGGVRHPPLLADRVAAARGLLRQVARLPCGHRGAALRPRGHRRSGERRERLLLPAHHQGDVFRRAGCRVRCRAARIDRGDGGHELPCRHLLCHGRRAACHGGAHRGGTSVLVPGFWLGPKAAARGYRLIGYDTVASTSSEAADAARAGDVGDVWFAALKQTAGRGRRGRQWETPYGNLAASLLIVPDADPTVAATLG